MSPTIMRPSDPNHRDHRRWLHQLKQDQEAAEREQANRERQRREREAVSAAPRAVDQRDELTRTIDARVQEASLTKYTLPQPAGPQPGTWQHEQMVAAEAARQERLAAARAEQERQAREREAQAERRRQEREQAAEAARGELRKLGPSIAAAGTTIDRLAPQVDEARALLERVTDLERKATTV